MLHGVIRLQLIWAITNLISHIMGHVGPHVLKAMFYICFDGLQIRMAWTAYS